MQLAGKNTRNHKQKHPKSQVKYLQTADKNTLNCRQKYPQLQAKIISVARKIPAIASNTAITQRTKFTCKLQVRVHPTGEVTRNLRASLRSVACILR